MRFFAFAIIVGAFAASNSKLDQITPLSMSMPDHVTKQFLFYSDSQSPDITFNDGFKANRSRNLPDDSRAGLVSRTQRDTTAIHHATSNNGSTTRYIYILSLEGSNDTASYDAEMYTSSTEKFIPAISGSVKPETIVGAYSFGNLHGGRHVIKEWIANPKYEHMNTSPYIAQGNSCLARACLGARHLASKPCHSIVSCLSMGGKKLQAREISRNLQCCLVAVNNYCVSGEALDPIAETPSTLKETNIGEVADIAEKVSQDEFVKLVKKSKLTQIIEKWFMSIPDVRKRLLNYKPLGPNSPKLRAGSGGTAGSLTIKAAGAAAWVGGVVEAFTRDASVLDRAAAVTSILPFFGCGTRLATEIDKGELSASTEVSLAMCLIGDGLIVRGHVTIGILVHLARLLVKTFTPPPKPPTKEEMQSVRDKHWQDFIKNILYSYIYSHEYLYPNRSFANKIENALAIEAMMVISEGAQSIGALNASGRVPDSNLDQQQLQSSSQDAAEKIREAISVEITGRQQRFLLGLPAVIRSNSTALLKTTAEKFNDDFIKKITSQATVDKYRSSQENPSPGGKLPGSQRLEYLQKLMYDIGQHLRVTPLPLPDFVEVAFILGQSKGLTNIDPLVLSPREYIKQQANKASGDDIDRVAIQHAFGILQLLQGKIKEQELPTIFPVEDSQSRQGLQLLLAIHIGKLYEEAKVKEANKLAGDYLPDSELQTLVHPWTPPLKERPDVPLFIGLILGISKDVVEARLAEPSS